MSCKYCNNIKEISYKYIENYEDDDGTIIFVPESKTFYVVTDEYHKLEINYCPNCGQDVRTI